MKIPKINLKLKSKRLAIDLGTANSLVIVEGEGIVVQEPTVVAYSKVDNKILAVGEEAKGMLGKAPKDVVVKRPLREGVIASFKLTEALIKDFIQKALGRVIVFKPEVMISVPSGLTSVEERAVIEAASQAGASKIYLIPEPIAAAIGAKMPISSSSGNMIINMGGGTAEIAVISMNGLVEYESKRMAGDAINDSIRNHVRKKYKLEIGEQMSEQIKMKIGSAVEYEDPIEMQVSGRDHRSGQPHSITLNSNDMVPPIREVLNEIIFSAKSVLERTPPELSSDIIDRGVVLSGGTALIREIDVLFTEALGVPVHRVESPLTAVVEGVEQALSHIDVLRRSLKS